MIYFIAFIFILSFLVIAHELGHFIVSKRSNVLVEEFGLGLPPRVYGKKKGETIYSLNALPIGGFVKLLGEDETDPEKLSNPRSFSAKKASTKALITVAGVVVNFLVAVTIFYFVLGFSGFNTYQLLIFDYDFLFGSQQNFPVVVKVNEESLAQRVGLNQGDIIIEGNGVQFEGSGQFAQFIDENRGKEVSLVLKDLTTKETRSLDIALGDEVGPLGVGLNDVADIRYETGFEKATAGFLHSANLAHYSVMSVGHLIKQSFEEKDVEIISSSVVGPIGIFAITKLTLAAGLIATLNLVALISLAFAMINIMPFPALDGGRLLIIGIEAITSRKIPPKIEKNVNAIGFALLILLIILISIKDFIQFKGVIF